MLLRCANQSSCYFPCSGPYCNGAVGRGGFFVTMRSTPDQQEVHYCLQCLEGLMVDQKMVTQTPQHVQHYNVDGASESRPSPIPMPYNFPSNSIEGRRLRQKRAEEIDEVLQSAKKRKQGESACTRPVAMDFILTKVSLHRSEPETGQRSKPAYSAARRPRRTRSSLQEATSHSVRPA